MHFIASVNETEVWTLPARFLYYLILKELLFFMSSVTRAGQEISIRYIIVHFDHYKYLVLTATNMIIILEVTNGNEWCEHYCVSTVVTQ